MFYYTSTGYVQWRLLLCFHYVLMSVLLFQCDETRLQGGQVHYTFHPDKGRGLFSPVGQNHQWVHRPAPEIVLLVRLENKHLALR